MRLKFKTADLIENGLVFAFFLFSTMTITGMIAKVILLIFAQ